MSFNYSHISWNEVLNHLDTLNIAGGGFTNSLSGIIHLSDDRDFFLKLAQDSKNAQWVNKEISVYKILNRHGYQYTPRLIVNDSARRGFLTFALSEKDGWEWRNEWDDKRLEATFVAMNALADIELTQDDKQIFNSNRGSYFHNGWIAINKNYDKTRFAYDRIDNKIGLDILKELYAIHDFTPKRDTLVHNDLRGGNTAYSKEQGIVMLVDWPWAEIGDKNLDTNALLVNVSCSGMKLSSKYQKLLRQKELHWLAGFWLDCAFKTWHEDKINVSESFIKSANKALFLAKEL
jgi:hypothetical protein